MDLNEYSEEQLLATRICDLPLAIEGTWLESCVQQLYRELDEHGISFKPVCYLADEWLAPDKEPLIGIPFYLAHPVLMELEEHMMREVEGGTPAWCMKLLRHEAGHAINYAYKLYQRSTWRTLFGAMSEPYHDAYRFHPYSKNFVQHLEHHYAQCHPDEDFAETFAVWVTPDSDWRDTYRAWSAYKKLEYVDALMHEIGPGKPLVRRGRKYWQARTTKSTLKTFYVKKQQRNAEDLTEFYDTKLESIFTPLAKSTYWTLGGARPESIPYAATLLRVYRAHIANAVARSTGEKKFIIYDVLQNIIARCEAKGLVLALTEQESLVAVTAYVTALAMNSLYTGTYGGRRWQKCRK